MNKNKNNYDYCYYQDADSHHIYDVRIGCDGRVSFRIEHQRFWLSFDPKDIPEEKSREHARFLKRQLTTALDKLIKFNVN